MSTRKTGSAFESAGQGIEIAKAISAARCARVSYLTHDGRRDHSKDHRALRPTRVSRTSPPVSLGARGDAVVPRMRRQETSLVGAS